MANKLTKISFRLRDNHRLSDTNYDSGPTGQFLKWGGEGGGEGRTDSKNGEKASNSV